MTDARLPSRWLHEPRMEDLSDRAWRTFTGMLMWSAEHGTDGVIPQRSLRLVHPDSVPASIVQELVGAELIEPRGGAVAILGWERSQSMAADVEGQRERNRAKNAALRQRERDKRTAQQEAPNSRGVTGHVTGHAGGEARTGEDKSGQEYKGGPAKWNRAS